MPCNGWAYRELLHPVRVAMVALYCSVLTKLTNCTRQSSSCRFSNNRALQNSIARIIRIINGRSPKAVVPTVFPTISIHLQHPKSIVKEIGTNRQPVKTIFRTVPIDRQCPRAFVWTIPINWKHQTSIAQSIPINRQSLKSIVMTIPINRETLKSFDRTALNC